MCLSPQKDSCHSHCTPPHLDVMQLLSSDASSKEKEKEDEEEEEEEEEELTTPNTAHVISVSEAAEEQREDEGEVGRSACERQEEGWR